MRRSSLLALSSLLLALPLAACGGDAPPEESGMDGMSAMNEAEAVPADEVEGDQALGDFEVLDTAPPGSEEVAGQAFLAQNDDGTTVTIRLTGLEPDTEYVSHLHEQSCDQDTGGEHFAFDPDGEEVPPNEVHLGFTSSADGGGEATVTNDRRVEDAAPAIVVHPADATDNRLACADFAAP